MRQGFFILAYLLASSHLVQQPGHRHKPCTVGSGIVGIRCCTSGRIHSTLALPVKPLMGICGGIGCVITVKQSSSESKACMCCITQAKVSNLMGTNLLELLKPDVCLVPWLPHPEVALQGLQELGRENEAGGRPMRLVNLQEQRLQLFLQPPCAASGRCQSSAHQSFENRV